MVELKCDHCTNNNQDKCSKLGMWLPNSYAKLYFGGVVDNSVYAGKCGVLSQPQ